MTHLDERGWSHPRQLLTLWTAVLLAPIAWALNLSVNYGIATLACDGAWSIALHLSTVVSIGLCAAGGLVAWGLWKRLSAVAGDDGTRAARSRFMALSGLLLSFFFGLAVVAQWLPTFFLEPCRY